MKKLKKPTRDQRKAIQGLKLNPAEWLVERDTPTELVIVSRNSDEEMTRIITIHKEN